MIHRGPPRPWRSEAAETPPPRWRGGLCIRLVRPSCPSSSSPARPTGGMVSGAAPGGVGGGRRADNCRMERMGTGMGYHGVCSKGRGAHARGAEVTLATASIDFHRKRDGGEGGKKTLAGTTGAPHARGVSTRRHHRRPYTDAAADVGSLPCRCTDRVGGRHGHERKDAKKQTKRQTETLRGHDRASRGRPPSGVAERGWRAALRWVKGGGMVEGASARPPADRRWRYGFAGPGR